MLGSAFLLTGCSFSDLMDRWMGMETNSADVSAASASSNVEERQIRTVDAALETPSFTQDLSGTMQMTVGSEYTLHVQAAVSDGGTVTYQWYRNNTNSNGGGTLLDGETGTEYTVDASVTGTDYYYVVATNEHGDRIAMSTSGIQSVIVWDEGQWIQEGDGSWGYTLTDGTRPVSTWMIIDGQTYYFDEAGGRVSGWNVIGESEYYFNENGELQKNATMPDGASTDENGARISES